MKDQMPQQEYVILLWQTFRISDRKNSSPFHANDQNGSCIIIEKLLSPNPLIA
jgi:hypothetical protein